jgi:hypothetical protein
MTYRAYLLETGHRPDATGWGDKFKERLRAFLASIIPEVEDGNP